MDGITESRGLVIEVEDPDATPAEPAAGTPALARSAAATEAG